MRVLVTGVSGYAGYYAALRLASAGHSVTGLVRNADAPRLNELRVHEITLTVGDVAEPASYGEILERSDVVLHAMLDKRNPLETDRTLFAAIAALPDRPGARRRFIYTTGNSIFGKVGVPIIDETVEPIPTHALAFRRTLEREALALPNVGVVVVRPGFMYGNDGFKTSTTEWFAMAQAGDAAFHGDNEKGWSWVHIDDLAEAYRLIVEADRAVDGEVFHVADDHRPRSVDVMRACLNEAGYRGDIRFEPPKQYELIGTWFDQNEFITSAKARRVLGWAPRHPGVIEGIPAAYRAWCAARTSRAAGPVQA